MPPAASASTEASAGQTPPETATAGNTNTGAPSVARVARSARLDTGAALHTDSVVLPPLDRILTRREPGSPSALPSATSMPSGVSCTRDVGTRVRTSSATRSSASAESDPEISCTTCARGAAACAARSATRSDAMDTAPRLIPTSAAARSMSPSVSASSPVTRQRDAPMLGAARLVEPRCLQEDRLDLGAVEGSGSRARLGHE